MLVIDPDYYTDRTIGIVDTWVDYMGNSEDAIFIGTIDDDSMFAGGRALFYAFPLGIISSSLRNCDFGIGFVPWPKADAQQEDYVTCTSNAYSLWSLPVAVEDPAMSAAVMEAMAYEGYVNITPALFETAYKVKYNETGNEMQSQVFDILRGCLTFDLGRIMSGTVTGDLYFAIPNAINAKKNNLSSRYATIEKKTVKQLEKWMEELADMETQ